VKEIDGNTLLGKAEETLLSLKSLFSGSHEAVESLVPPQEPGDDEAVIAWLENLFGFAFAVTILQFTPSEIMFPYVTLFSEITPPAVEFVFKKNVEFLGKALIDDDYLKGLYLCLERWKDVILNEEWREIAKMMPVPTLGIRTVMNATQLLNMIEKQEENPN
jgi:hypothetical protein